MEGSIMDEYLGSREDVECFSHWFIIAELYQEMERVEWFKYDWFYN